MPRDDIQFGWEYTAYALVSSRSPEQYVNSKIIDNLKPGVHK